MIKQIKELLDHYYILLADTKRKLGQSGKSNAGLMIWQKKHTNDLSIIQEAINKLERLYELEYSLQNELAIEPESELYKEV